MNCLFRFQKSSPVRLPAYLYRIAHRFECFGHCAFHFDGRPSELGPETSCSTRLPLGKPETLAHSFAEDRNNYSLIAAAPMELRRNQHNYFAEAERSAFSPANIVPAIGFSPDKLLRVGAKDRSMSTRCWHKHYRNQPG
jgi:hypothetical protein